MKRVFGSLDNRQAGGHAAWVCVTSPDSGAEPAVVRALGRRGEDSTFPRGEILHAIAQHRAGESRRAAELLGELAERGREWRDAPLIWVALGLALRADSRPEEARPWLARAERWLQEVVKDGSPAAAPPGWEAHCWLHFLLMLREASNPGAERALAQSRR